MRQVRNVQHREILAREFRRKAAAHRRRDGVGLADDVADHRQIFGPQKQVVQVLRRRPGAAVMLGQPQQYQRGSFGTSRGYGSTSLISIGGARSADDPRGTGSSAAKARRSGRGCPPAARPRTASPLDVDLALEQVALQFVPALRAQPKPQLRMLAQQPRQGGCDDAVGHPGIGADHDEARAQVAQQFDLPPGLVERGRRLTRDTRNDRAELGGRRRRARARTARPRNPPRCGGC